MSSLPAPPAVVAARRGGRHPLSVAPMMDRTDRHFRFLARAISRRTLLYTEMITSGAVLHGDRDRLLAFHPAERPLALQLGGDEPEALARCARIGWERGYDEVNLNVGCPSDRVQQGSFGVCLMARPERVADAVAAMRAACPLPVTVKHRIGFDDLDRYEDMLAFVDTVAGAGCDRFSVHARKAWLSGVSPKENRELPPLRHADVVRLKADRPALSIEINGGLRSLDEARAFLAAGLDGAMIGRAAYDAPWMLAAADAGIYGEPLPAGEPPTRRTVLAVLADYVAGELSRGEPLARVVRHWQGLFTGERGGRYWRRVLGEGARRPGAGPGLLAEAAAEVPSAVLDAPSMGAPPEAG